MKKSILLAVGLGLGLALTRSSVALAHAIMLFSVPTPNSFYPASDPPTQVEITFSEEVVPAFSTIHVFNRAGEAVDNGDTHAVNPARTTLAVSLKLLQPDIYTVAWEVLSTVDGHLTNGSFAFGVGVAQATALIQTANAGPGPTPASLGARWLALTGQVILLGVFAFHLFVWRPALNSSDPEDARLDLAMAGQALRVGWAALGLVGLGLILTLIAQQVLTVARFGIWLGTRFGGMWAIRFWLSAGLAFGLADLGLGVKQERLKGLRGWEWWAGLILSIAVGLTATLTSHSAALQGAGGGLPLLAVVSDGAHVLAAGIWVGGLVQLFIATRLTQTSSSEARVRHNLNLALNFSALAAVAVGILLVSGGYLAWQHVGTWAALFGTPYGVALLVKIGLALPAFAVAALNLLVIKPRLAAAASMPDSDRAPVQRRFNRLVLVEASFALAAVVAAGLLADLQRGRDALLLAQQAQAIFTQPAEDLQVTLTLEPARWTQANTFDVYLFAIDGKPLLNAREVSLRFKFLGHTIGPSKATLEPLGNGHYRTLGNYLTLGGTWEVEVAVRRPDAYDTFATFQLETSGDGVIRPLTASSNWAEQLAGWLTQRGGWLTGGALILFSFAWGIPAVLAARRKIDLALLLLPSLITMGVGVSQLVGDLSGPPVAPSGDPQALAWLAESDAAMNKLTSAQLLRTTRGDSASGAVLTETVAFQAPNLFYDVLSNGSENMAQGTMYYYRSKDALHWQAVRQNEPFIFPDFDFSLQAVSARLGKTEDVDGRPAQKVTFTVYVLRNPFAYVRWIDVDTKLILRETMDAPGHHMLSIYHDYNAPVVIPLPAPSEIGPTPTVTIP